MLKKMPLLKSQQNHRFFVMGLMLCSIMVFGMILLGGVTRLMGAGLSIVNWHPITGIIPPVTEQGWQHEFNLYQQFPEYQKINFGMTLAEFKSIFWLEYLHRLWGRLMGAVLLAPTMIALFNKPLRPFLPPLFIVWALGGLQGIMGWYMVKSGLIDHPWVSPYRLTIHLCLALVILAVLLRMLFPFFKPQASTKEEKKLTPWVSLLLGCLLAAICMGGFTAGLKAGHLYNTFPTMDGQWAPHDLLFLKPLWRNVFENPSTVQFCHRILAMSTWIAAMALITRSFSLTLQSSTRKALAVVGILVTLQIGLGIATLLLGAPLVLSALHQTTAVILFAAVTWVWFLIRNTKHAP